MTSATIGDLIIVAHDFDDPYVYVPKGTMGLVMSDMTASGLRRVFIKERLYTLFDTEIIVVGKVE